MLATWGVATCAFQHSCELDDAATQSWQGREGIAHRSSSSDAEDVSSSSLYTPQANLTIVKHMLCSLNA